jgi:hypothetical protein
MSGYRVARQTAGGNGSGLQRIESAIHRRQALLSQIYVEMIRRTAEKKIEEKRILDMINVIVVDQP